MGSRLMRSVIFLTAVSVLSSPAVAQVFFPPAGGIPPSAEARAAAAAAPKPAYDPHDLSGVWWSGDDNQDPDASIRSAKRTQTGELAPDHLMGGSPAPPMTAWGQEQFNAHKPSSREAPASRRVPPALGNDPLGTCDPLGYPRNLGGGPFEMVQTPGKIVQIFENGRRLREIWTDGRKLPADLDPRWYGWAVGHWEGDTLVVDSTGYDERTWLDGAGYPHSEGMHLQERYSHPDAMTLEITMTLDDPKAYAKPWVGRKQTYRLLLPKGLMVLDEIFCVPSEEQSFNEGVRNPAAGVASKNK
jgi:hypothetical protein